MLKRYKILILKIIIIMITIGLILAINFIKINFNSLFNGQYQVFPNRDITIKVPKYSFVKEKNDKYVSFMTLSSTHTINHLIENYKQHLMTVECSNNTYTVYYDAVNNIIIKNYQLNKAKFIFNQFFITYENGSLENYKDCNYLNKF